MAFLAPAFFYLGVGLAAAAVALHFIVTRQPTSSPLPTARFVPRGSVRVTTIDRPRHWWLLLARVCIALLVGAAFARPVRVPERRAVARIVLADVSRAGGRQEVLRDTVAALLQEGDALVAFDTGARVIRVNVADSARALRPTHRPSRLSPALVLALRTAATMRDVADSVELVIVSGLRAGQMDAATNAIRSLWPGRIRLIPLAAPADSSQGAGIDVRSANAHDGVSLAAAIGGPVGRGASVRVDRTAGQDADSAWVASPGSRRTLVRWPAVGAPRGWRARAAADTAGAVVIGEAALVYPLERRWEIGDAAGHRVIARWVDGEPAAIERTAGEGCIRDVAIPVPTEGDVVLRPAFMRLLRELTTPCGSLAAAGPPLSSAQLAMLEGDGPLASRDAIRASESVRTPIVPWLILAAALLLMLELWLRRGAPPLWTAADGVAPATHRKAA